MVFGMVLVSEVCCNKNPFKITLLKLKLQLEKHLTWREGTVFAGTKIVLMHVRCAESAWLFSNLHGLTFWNTLENHVLLKICLLACSDIT